MNIYIYVCKYVVKFPFVNSIHMVMMVCHNVYGYNNNLNIFLLTW